MELISDFGSLINRLGISKNTLPIFYRSAGIKFFIDNDVVVPFSVKRNYFLRLCRIEFSPLKNNLRISAAEEKIILEHFLGFIAKNRMADRIIPSPNYVIFNSVPEKTKSCRFGTYRLSLDPPVDVLWSRVHTKHKNVVRNAEKHQVVLKFGENEIETFYRLYQQTMNRSKMFCEDLGHFQDMYKAFPNNTVCGVAYYHDKPQGALFVPFSEFGAFYLYGASAEKMEINGAFTFLQWRTMLLLKEKGVKLYDFVGARLSDVLGTKLEGIQRFKERFGSELVSGFLWKIDLNTVKCATYDSLLRIKTRIRGGSFPKDIIDQENEKAIA